MEIADFLLCATDIYRHACAIHDIETPSDKPVDRNDRYASWTAILDATTERFKISRGISQDANAPPPPPLDTLTAACGKIAKDLKIRLDRLQGVGNNEKDQEKMRAQMQEVWTVEDINTLGIRLQTITEQWSALDSTLE